MMPKTHILLGAIFSLVLYFSFNLNFPGLLIIFLASFLIDIDHYFFYVHRMKNWSLNKASKWYFSLAKHHKPIMHIFHTFEFLLLISLLSSISPFFFFLFVGVIFHSILDITEMIYNNRLEVREFFLTRYLLNKNKGRYF